jgi:predicted glutamine amidotransferase
MCTIAYAINRKVTPDEIRKMFTYNTHGAGYAIKRKNSVYYKKGFFDVNRFLDEVVNLDPPYVLHFRVATSGGVTKELTHPFVVTLKNKNENEGYAKSVLFQNGVTNFEELFFLLKALGVKLPEKINQVSDTLVIAKTLALIQKLNGNYKNFLEGLRSKFILFTNKKINVFGNFINKNGVLFSNDYWSYDFGFSYKRNIESFNVTPGIGFNQHLDDGNNEDYYIPYKYRGF